MAGAVFKVIASSLSLRAQADAASARLAVIPGGALVTDIAPSARPGWINVAWKDQTGYVAAAYVQAVDSSGAALPAGPLVVGPAPAVAVRDFDLGKLHPAVRAAVSATLATLAGEGIAFGVFEAFRPPERQAWLYAQGRTRPGGVVTRSQPWQSYHQYGLAADLVLKVDGQWSWDSSGDKAALWKRMQTVAGANNLRALDFELPHVEFAGPDWRVLQQDQDFPAGGDDGWFDTVSLAAARWSAVGKDPAAPPLTLAERPPLAEQAAQNG